MLWRASELEGYEIAATNGAIGSVDDLLFDDTRWGIRWLVIDTGGWLGGRDVLLPPEALGRPSRDNRRLPVTLTRKQVEQSPALTTDRPVSRQTEADLYRHYGWTPYWENDLSQPLNWLSSGGPQSSGFLFPPGQDVHAAPATAGAKPAAAARPAGDPHLQSVHDVTGHAIHAADGDIGHVEDFLIEDGPWAIRYMVVDTRNWLPGRKVLISPHWIRAVDWPGRRVVLELDRAQVESSPEWDPAHDVSRDTEARLHRHYGQPVYWP